MLRVIIVGIVTAAVAVAIAITFREDDALVWRGPDFIAPGAKLPDANFGEEPPAAPVIHVSKKWVTSRGRRVASADEVISDTDSVVDGLYEELYSIGEPPGKCGKSYKLLVEIDFPHYGPVIIQADRDVEYELLSRVLYTCGRAEYGSYLAAINRESRELDALSLEWPYYPYPFLRPPAVQSKAEPRLLVGDDSFYLSYRDASRVPVSFTIAAKDYSLLGERLREMQRRCPELKSLVIACGAHVEYGDLVRVLEIAVQPGIALTEIYLSFNPVSDSEK